MFKVLGGQHGRSRNGQGHNWNREGLKGNGETDITGCVEHKKGFDFYSE